MVIFRIIFCSSWHHIHYYANKALSTIKGMKMLSNLTGGLSSIPKHLLYRTCILPIALYGFQLWYFKGASLYQPIKELKKMQKRMVLQIMEAFCTSLSWKVETISGLILDHFHLDKLIGHHYLRVAFLSKQHMLNFLLNIHHSKQADFHCMATSCLTPKQYLKIKSPTVDTNNCLNQVLLAFNSLNKELSLGFCLIDNFSNCFSFHTVDCKDVKARTAHCIKTTLLYQSCIQCYSSYQKNLWYISPSVSTKLYCYIQQFKEVL